MTKLGTLGSHISFRKIVPPSHSVGGKLPTYIALGDVSPGVGRVKYSLTYQSDFGAAMRGHINSSWSPPKFLDLSSAWHWLGGGGSGSDSVNTTYPAGGGGMKYFYPTLLDVRSPELGLVAGTVAAQEDGDSYALVSFPRRVPREYHEQTIC